MTDEQASLIIRIVSRLDDDAVTGEWPNQKCRHCPGGSGGYPFSQSFDHREECIIPLIEELRRTTYEQGE